ncbi:MAG: hypothetical protein KIT31_07205 [Deltaproteobacteria bacterium]|nr:hypothetical protein [Deltaproteobacteria bacterium]
MGDAAQPTPADSRSGNVRAYEDAFSTFAPSFVEKARGIEGRAAALSLLQEYAAWSIEHPEPKDMMPPQRPGSFLDPSGRQPTAAMYRQGFALTVWRARLQAVVDGQPLSVLRDGIQGELVDVDIYNDQLRKTYCASRPKEPECK